MTLSARNDRCGACGEPLFVCPATVRRFVRCCARCTHRTLVDVRYETMHPDYREYFGCWPVSERPCSSSTLD